MSNYPNPFTTPDSQSQNFRSPRTSMTPNFLTLIRPPMNPYYSGGGRGGYNNNNEVNYQAPICSDNFIPLGHCQQNEASNSPGYRSGGSNSGGRFMRRDGNQNNGSRFNTPYQNIGKNFNTPDRNFNNSEHFTPTNYRGGFNNRGNNSFHRGNNHGGRTPLKDIPIDKFISPSMMMDPWRSFDCTIKTKRQTLAEQSSVVTNSCSTSNNNNSKSIIDNSNFSNV